MYFIYLFDITTAVVAPDPKIFSGISKPATDAAAVNPNGIKILLSNGWSTFFNNSKPTYSNGPNSLPRNLSDCIIFDI